LDRSSLGRFEASPYRLAPKDLPSSFVQHDAFTSSWHNTTPAFGAARMNGPYLGFGFGRRFYRSTRKSSKDF